MTWRKRTIMEMAKECDLIAGNAEHGIYIMALERFAALVREEATAEANAKANASWTLMCEKMVAIEREECAQFLESTNLGGLPEGTARHYAMLLIGFANSIRARGEQA